jgi:hypothetical protein
MKDRNNLGLQLDGLVWPGDEAVARLLCGEYCACRGHHVRSTCPIEAARAVLKLIKATSASPLAERASTAIVTADKLNVVVQVKRH